MTTITLFEDFLHIEAGGLNISLNSSNIGLRIACIRPDGTTEPVAHVSSRVISRLLECLVHEVERTSS